MAIQFAKALGCEEIVAFSHSTRKQEDAMALGATKFVATKEEGFQKPLLSSLDLIVVSQDGMKIYSFLTYGMYSVLPTLHLA